MNRIGKSKKSFGILTKNQYLLSRKAFIFAARYSSMGIDKVERTKLLHSIVDERGLEIDFVREYLSTLKTISSTLKYFKANNHDLCIY